MSILAGVKVFADLCLLLCGTAMATCWTGSPAALLAPPLLGALSVMLGCGEKRFLRFPALLLPVVGFVWATTPARLAVTGAITAYAALVVICNRTQLEHGAYCEYFVRGLWAVAVFTFLSLLFGTWRSAVLFALLYAFSGVFLMRQLRMGPVQSRLSQLVNLGALTAVTALGTALLGGLWALGKLRFIFSWVWNRVVNVLLAVIWGVAIALGWLWKGISALLALLGINSQQTIPEADGSAITVNNMPYFEPVDSDPTVFYILMAIVAAALAIWLARRAMAPMARAEKSPRRAVTTEKLETAPTGFSLFAPGSPRDKVRQSYRRFLRLLQKRGAQLSSAQTTEEMHRAAGQLAAEQNAKALRALYLTARYDENAQVTAKEAKEAKELLKELEKTS